jgi:hypothetical protein
MNTDASVNLLGRRIQPDAVLAWFVKSGSLILLTAGLAKLFSSFGHDGILDQSDSVFKVSLRFLMRWVGFIEILVSVVCFLSRKQGLNVALIAVMATDFALYRVGMVYTGWRRPCPCLGSLTGLLHLPQWLADWIVIAMLVYLIVGSYTALFWLCRTKLLFGPTGRNVAVAPSKVIIK